MKRILFSLENDIHHSLKLISVSRKTSMQEIVVGLIITYINDNKELLPEDLCNKINQLVDDG